MAFEPIPPASLRGLTFFQEQQNPEDDPFEANEEGERTEHRDAYGGEVNVLTVCQGIAQSPPAYKGKRDSAASVRNWRTNELYIEGTWTALWDQPGTCAADRAKGPQKTESGTQSQDNV